MQKVKNNKQGFTIIEVVLVLAIAGLIFLIVFLALPRLQRSRRDTARKNDLGTALSQLEQYAGNNNSVYPPDQAATTTFKNGYLQNLKDPQTGNSYTVTYQLTDPGSDEISYRDNAKCVGQVLTDDGTNPGKVAVGIKLESGGTFCKDNQ